MNKNKRLFLFAGYDKDNIIDDALIYYIRALSNLGDVIFFGDSDFSATELSKIKPYTIYSAGKRHGEYDFGSYKRAYQHASDNKLLSKYDFIYMVNDSVYGPTFDPGPALSKMESLGTDAFGFVQCNHRKISILESWFIGMRSNLATSQWFYEFITSVKQEKSKGSVASKYENGFTKLLNKNNIKWQCLIHVRPRGVYNRVKKLYKQGCPFIKKNSFIRHNGALGRQILYVLNHSQTYNIIVPSAERIYGKEHINWLLTNSPIKILFRNLRFASRKLIRGGIWKKI